MGIGSGELFIIFLAVLLLFGANKIPEIARGLGKGLHEFKKASEEIKREINAETNDLGKDFKEIKDDLNKTV